jgi:threonine dehydratase
MPSDADVDAAAATLGSVVGGTPLQPAPRLSALTGLDVWLKREDLTPVRSYKVRGAFNVISGLSAREREAGVACASAGNHAQGVAFACAQAGVRATIFLPGTTPRQKRDRVAALGGASVDVVIAGETYDDSVVAAADFAAASGATVIPAFDHPGVIAGQGTVTAEILVELAAEGRSLDALVVPVGGAGLLAGALAAAALRLPEVGLAPGSTVVAVVSGGNNDVSRYADIVERALIFEGLKHYFLVEFPQEPGALRRFLDEVLGPDDDITLFEYTKRNNRETGPALVGIEMQRASDLDGLLARMEDSRLRVQRVAPDSPLFGFILAG